MFCKLLVVTVVNGSSASYLVGNWGCGAFGGDARVKGMSNQDQVWRVKSLKKLWSRVVEEVKLENWYQPS